MDKKLSEEQLREKLITAIEVTEQILSEATEENKRVYAANTLSGLIKQYKSLFLVEDDENKEKPKLRSIKNF